MMHFTPQTNWCKSVLLDIYKVQFNHIEKQRNVPERQKKIFSTNL